MCVYISIYLYINIFIYRVCVVLGYAESGLLPRFALIDGLGVNGI